MVCVDDPQLMLDKSLGEVSDFLQGELDEKVMSGGVPLTGLVLDGYSNEGVPVRLEIRLSVRGEE